MIAHAETVTFKIMGSSVSGPNQTLKLTGAAILVLHIISVLQAAPAA
jgi:hypothetical protein